ncbi:hypothetical protein ACIHDR_47025 [Nocardia sp. NPDC052278]|uniref:hypothetical protein n=1 Tax=unclassified Nocardia TaxID=2637762 RepID=UPI003696D803
MLSAPVAHGQDVGEIAAQPVQPGHGEPITGPREPGQSAEAVALGGSGSGRDPEMERTFTAERAAHARALAESKGRHIGRPTAWPDDKIDYAWLLREQGSSLGEITTKTGIPKTSLHRYLTPATEQE